MKDKNEGNILSVKIILCAGCLIFFSAPALSGAEGNNNQAAPSNASPLLISKEGTSESGKPKMIVKTISGKVGLRSMSGFAVTTSSDETKGDSTEMWFNYSESSSLTRLSEGDFVTVIFEQPEEGGRRRLKEVRVLKKNESKE